LKPFVLNVLRLRKQGITVVPSAKAANFTMNRKAIRDLASKELGLKQPTTAMQLLQPNCDKESKPWECLVKPLMSSSGKGQSTIKTDADIEKAWQYAVEGSEVMLLKLS
jgi:phosphoribosylglycinamide formyltransferase 2